MEQDSGAQAAHLLRQLCEELLSIRVRATVGAQTSAGTLDEAQQLDCLRRILDRRQPGEQLFQDESFAIAPLKPHRLQYAHTFLSLAGVLEEPVGDYCSIITTTTAVVAVICVGCKTSMQFSSAVTILICSWVENSLTMNHLFVQLIAHD